jgi:hypothetical protein
MYRVAQSVARSLLGQLVLIAFVILEIWLPVEGNMKLTEQNKNKPALMVTSRP